MFSDELRGSSFHNRLPHYAWAAAWSAHSDIVGSRVSACLGVICHLHFWQNDRGLLRATAVRRGWNRHRIKSQYTKLTPEKKILPAAPVGIQTCNLSITSPALQPTSCPGVYAVSAVPFVEQCHHEPSTCGRPRPCPCLLNNNASIQLRFLALFF